MRCGGDGFNAADTTSGDLEKTLDAGLATMPRPWTRCPPVAHPRMLRIRRRGGSIERSPVDGCGRGQHVGNAPRRLAGAWRKSSRSRQRSPHAQPGRTIRSRGRACTAAQATPRKRHRSAGAGRRRPGPDDITTGYAVSAKRTNTGIAGARNGALCAEGHESPVSAHDERSGRLARHARHGDGGQGIGRSGRRARAAQQGVHEPANGTTRKR